MGPAGGVKITELCPPAPAPRSLPIEDRKQLTARNYLPFRAVVGSRTFLWGVITPEVSVAFADLEVEELGSQRRQKSSTPTSILGKRSGSVFNNSVDDKSAREGCKPTTFLVCNKRSCRI